MLKVGITGGIGSGKSTVAKIFRILGVPVFDADSAAKNIMNHDPHVKRALIQLFGEEVYINGVLNRAYLSKSVFDSEARLKQLNEITHPATIRKAQEWMLLQKAPYILKEAALLFETGTAADLDIVIGVKSPAPLRILRTMQRSGLSREAVLKRMDKQMDDDLKMKLCDYIIYNDEQHPVIPQVLALHAKFSLDKQKER